MLALTHALAITAGPAVRVDAISPGWIADEGWKKSSVRTRPKLRRIDHAQHRPDVSGTPEEIIGALAVYLLSGALSGFVTGQDLSVDGGVRRRMQYA